MGRPAKRIKCPHCKSSDISKENIGCGALGCVCNICGCDFERSRKYKINMIAKGRDNPMDCVTYLEENCR